METVSMLPSDKINFLRRNILLRMLCLVTGYSLCYSLIVFIVDEIFYLIAIKLIETLMDILHLFSPRAASIKWPD